MTYRSSNHQIAQAGSLWREPAGALHRFDLKPGQDFVVRGSRKERLVRDQGADVLHHGSLKKTNVTFR